MTACKTSAALTERKGFFGGYWVPLIPDVFTKRGAGSPYAIAATYVYINCFLTQIYDFHQRFLK